MCALFVLDTDRRLEKDTNLVGVALALGGGDTVGELNFAATALHTVKPELVQLTAPGDFVTGDDVYLVANTSGKGSDAQVIAVRTVRAVVVVVEDGRGSAAIPRNDLDLHVIVNVLQLVVSVRSTTDDESVAFLREGSPAARTPPLGFSPPLGRCRVSPN